MSCKQTFLKSSLEGHIIFIIPNSEKQTNKLPFALERDIVIIFQGSLQISLEKNENKMAVSASVHRNMRPFETYLP